MNRKSFLRKSLFGAASIATASSVLGAEPIKKPSTYDRLLDQVGYSV